MWRPEITLLGRNWLNELQIDWVLLHSQWATYHVKQESSVLDKYPKLFTGAGALKNMAVSLVVGPAVPPRHFKPRTLPYAMRAKVEEELVRFGEGGNDHPGQDVKMGITNIASGKVRWKSEGLR